VGPAKDTPNGTPPTTASGDSLGKFPAKGHAPPLRGLTLNYTDITGVLQVIFEESG
jgi:hypothetical protein